MRDYLSISQIGMFLRCPAQYEFRYIKDIKIPPAGALIQGKAYHEAVASDLNTKLRAGKGLSSSDIADIFVASFDEQVHQKVSDDEGELEEFEEIDWGDDDPGLLKDQGVTLSRMYHEKFVPNITPVSVEEKKETSIGGVKFVLVTDLITADKIIDHKLKKKRFSDNDLKQDIQATAYTMIHRKPFEFHQALKLKTPAIEVAVAERSQNDWSFFEGLVQKVSKAIQSGVFYPNPTGWACSPDWCGYWKLCKGRDS